MARIHVVVAIREEEGTVVSLQTEDLGWISLEAAENLNCGEHFFTCKDRDLTEIGLS